MIGGLPTVWIPNLHTMTDDQDARARWADDHGLGLRVTEGDKGEIRASVEQMFDDTVRAGMAQRLASVGQGNGAATAGALVSAAWRAFLQNRGGIL